MRGAQLGQPFVEAARAVRKERSTAKSSSAGSSVETYFSAEASPTPGKRVRQRTSATRSLGLKASRRKAMKSFTSAESPRHQSAIFAVGNLLELEGQLHRFDRARRARQHGDLGGLRAALDPLANPVDDVGRFAHRRGERHQLGLALIALGAGQDERARAALHHAIGQVENLLAGTIILFEADDARVGMFLEEEIDQPARGAAKTEDRLVDIADDGEVIGVRAWTEFRN